MLKQRNWFWEIEESGQGPDYFLTATFAPANAERLAELVRTHPLPGFVYDRDRVMENPYRRGKCKLYEAFYTEHYFQVKGDTFTCSLIEICDNQLRLECGYGGHKSGPVVAKAETDLVLSLAASSEISLIEWQLGYCGDYYGVLASGTSSSELRDYLFTEEASTQTE
jgi:hypothetical protein